MEVLKFPHKLLLTKTEPVTVFNDELMELVDEMFKVMDRNGGIGLAANQVGIPYSFFITQLNNGERICLVNPKIKCKSYLPAKIAESCLSAPGETIVVPERAYWVEVQYQDLLGRTLLRAFRDVDAVCVQHEMDHLDGVAFLKNKSIKGKIRHPLKKKWGLK